jgi:leader peptidase (prepilin peptidase) / N-methyltransferase
VNTPLLAAFAFFILGAIAASFAGVVAERFHTGQSWTAGRSRCNACGKRLRFYDLIPVVSWIVYAGRCSACYARLPHRYMLSELLLGILFVGAYQVTGLTISLIPLLFAFTVLLSLVLYDLRHMIVPPEFSLSFIAFAALYLILSSPGFVPSWLVIIESISIALFLFLFYFFSRGKAMGLGDPPIALGLSFITGSYSIAGLVFSFWIGAVIGIIVLLGRRPGHRMGIEVPFVPFLASGFLLAFFTQWNPFSF